MAVSLLVTEVPEVLQQFPAPTWPRPASAHGTGGPRACPELQRHL